MHIRYRLGIYPHVPFSPPAVQLDGNLLVARVELGRDVNNPHLKLDTGLLASVFLPILSAPAAQLVTAVAAK